MSQRKAYRARGNSPTVEYLPTIPQQQPGKQTVHVETGRSLYPGNCLSSLLGHFILLIMTSIPAPPPQNEAVWREHCTALKTGSHCAENDSKSSQF